MAKTGRVRYTVCQAKTQAVVQAGFSQITKVAKTGRVQYTGRQGKRKESPINYLGKKKKR